MQAQGMVMIVTMDEKDIDEDDFDDDFIDMQVTLEGNRGHSLRNRGF